MQSTEHNAWHKEITQQLVAILVIITVNIINCPEP